MGRGMMIRYFHLSRAGDNISVPIRGRHNVQKVNILTHHILIQKRSSVRQWDEIDVVAERLTKRPSSNQTVGAGVVIVDCF